MVSKGPQITLVQDAIGILLRIGDPYQQIGPLRHVIRPQPVLGHHGIVIRKIEQHQARWRVLGGRNVMAARNPEPIKQVGRAAAGQLGRISDCCQGERRRRALSAGAGEFAAHQRVKDRRLPCSGRPGECNHGVLG